MSVTVTVEQISEVAYEAVRAYGHTIGQPIPEWLDAADLVRKATFDRVVLHLNNYIRGARISSGGTTDTELIDAITESMNKFLSPESRMRECLFRAVVVEFARAMATTDIALCCGEEVKR